MTQADRIREYVMTAIIEPARQEGKPSVSFTAWDVHEGLGLESRVPAVCGAIDSQKFLDYTDITLVERQGPKQSSSVTWTFRV